MMKKMTALLLSVLLVLSLAACGQTDDSQGDRAYTPTSALDLLDKVWASYTDDEKFPVIGGNYSETELVEDAPGTYDLTDRSAADSGLGLPETAAVDEAATLVHAMNGNTFTAFACHATGDTAALAAQLRDHLQQRHWMCGFPDKLAVAVVGEYVLTVYGAEDLVDGFVSHYSGICGASTVVYDEAVL